MFRESNRSIKWPLKTKPCFLDNFHLWSSLPLLYHKLVRQRSNWRRSGEYVQHRVCFVNIQLSLHENVVFSVCACMGNAAYIIFIMWNSISGLDAWYHFRFNVSYGVAVTVRSHQIKFQVIFQSSFLMSSPFLRSSSLFLVPSIFEVVFIF